MNDMNVCVLTGRLTRDAELRFTNGGTAVSNFSIAVNESAKQQDGSYADKACFFDVQLWGKSAESLQQYLTKGRQITINGRLKQETWQDQHSGQNRSKVVINASQLQLLSEPGQRQQDNQQGYQNRQQAPAKQSYPQQSQQQPQSWARRPPQQNQFEDTFGPPPVGNAFDPPLKGGSGVLGPELFDDDIPF